MSPTATPPPARGIFLARVIDNVPLCREHWRLVLGLDAFPDARPGQFLQILCTEPSDEGWNGGVFLRRPFSIGGLRRTSGGVEVDILHRAVGPGTRWLAQRHPGDAVDLLGPLGTPFRMPPPGVTALLVGGGIGLPPLMWLAEALRAGGHPVVAFVGSRSADLLPLTRIASCAVAAGQASAAWAEFARVDVPALVATDDGSLGTPGRVPDAFAAWLDGHPELTGTSAAVYTCGPDRMMQATAAICELRGLPCQVCLERVMGCGMATCQSCVVRVRDTAAPDGWRYRLCCTDGPAFDSREVIWGE